MFPARKCCRCQMPVTRVLYAKQWYTENRLTREQCPPVNSLYHAAFQNILEFRIIPFSMIQEISGCNSVLTADFSEFNGISPNKKSTRIIKTLIDFFFFIKVKIKMVCFSVPSLQLRGNFVPYECFR